MVTEAHANLMAVIALALGAAVATAVPAMVRDVKTWKRELWPDGPTRKPARGIDEAGR